MIPNLMYTIVTWQYIDTFVVGISWTPGFTEVDNSKSESALLTLAEIFIPLENLQLLSKYVWYLQVAGIARFSYVKDCLILFFLLPYLTAWTVLIFYHLNELLFLCCCKNTDLISTMQLLLDFGEKK